MIVAADLAAAADDLALWSIVSDVVEEALPSLATQCGSMR